MISILAVILAVTTQPSLSIQGKVTDPQGKAIENAKVYVLAAEPRAEAAANCPTEYVGVGNVIATESDGRFALAELDSRLTYEVAIAADHYKAQHRRFSIDTKKPVVIKLAPLPKDVNNDNCVTGHVVDGDGKPIAGALITLQGEKYQGGHSYGGIKNVDQFAVSGDDGAFIMIADKPGRQFDVLFEHPRYAPQLAHPSSGENCEITLTPGVKVTGRVVKDGQPLAGVQIGLTQADRNMDRYIGMFSIGTDADGKFTVEHVPENDQYDVLATMQSLGERGCCRPVHVKVDTADADADDLNIEPGVTVSGTVVLSEGQKLPPNATASLSIEDNFDGATTKVKPDGTFKFVGVPTGVVRLYIQGKGLAMSKENVSYYANYHSMMGQVTGDTTLRVKLEPHSNADQYDQNDREENYTSKQLEGISDESK